MLALKEMRDEVRQFAKNVAPIYALLGWKWGGISRGRVPNAKDIEETLMELLQEVKESGKSWETGGLRVERTSEGTYIMSFRVEHWVGMGSTYNLSN